MKICVFKKLMSAVLAVTMLLSVGAVASASAEQTFDYDEIVTSLGEMLNYGVFAKEYAGQPHMESTIATAKATQLGEYGFSSNNFKLINNKITVSYNTDGKHLYLIVLRNGEVYSEKAVCGEGVLSLEKVPGGEYEVAFKEEEHFISVEGNTKLTVDEAYGNVSYIGKLEGITSIGMPVGPGIVLLNDKNDYENNKNYNARQGVSVQYTEDAIDFDANLQNAADLSVKLASAVTGGSFKVYNLTAAQLNSNDVVNNGFKSDGYEYILVNVDMTGENDAYIQGNYKRDGVSMGANFTDNWRAEAKMIYNIYSVENGKAVPYTATVREQNPLTGILLAPKATVYGAGNHGGIIIADKYYHTKGEVHQMRPDAESFEGSMDIKVKQEAEHAPETPVIPETPVVPEIEEEYHEDTGINLKGASYAYIFGYEPVFGSFINEKGETETYVEVEMGMDDPVTVEQVSSMLMRMLDQSGNTRNAVYPVTPAVKPHEGQWYERGLAYLCAMGGFDSETPIQTKAITRGKVAKLVSCALKLNMSKDTPFTDISGHVYEEYIKKVYRYGYMKGQSEDSFAPDDIMTRAEFCNLFNNIIGRNSMGLKALDEDGNEYTITAEDYYFVDMDPDHWAYEICLKATSAYNEDGHVDVVTRTANIRNVLDHHDAQKLH